MTELEQIARNSAAAHKLNPALLCALIETESSWNPKATRYEAAFQKHYIDPMNLPAQEAQDRSTSWGLCQIMGQTAIEFGWKGRLQDLLEPVNGIEWGCRKLAQCFKNALKKPIHMPAAHAYDRLALLTYNGGADKDYPDRVLSKIGKYAGQVVTNSEEWGES